MIHQTQPLQNLHPKVLINIILINSSESKILFVKKENKSYWNILGHILEYGETLEERIKEIMCETTFELEEYENILDKIQYLCSFNADDREKKRHFVELMYAMKMDDGKRVFVNPDIFRYRWMRMEEIKNEKLFFGFEKFIEKYKVKEIKDILKIKSI